MMEYFKGMARNIDGVGDEKADLLDTDPEKTPVHLPLELEDKSSSKEGYSTSNSISDYTPRRSKVSQPTASASFTSASFSESELPTPLKRTVSLQDISSSSSIFSYEVSAATPLSKPQIVKIHSLDNQSDTGKNTETKFVDTSTSPPPVAPHQAKLKRNVDTDEPMQQIKIYSKTLYNYLCYVKANKITVSVQHIKIILTGSASAGKTSFCHLLLNSPFSNDEASTDILEARLAYAIHNSASVLQSKTGDTIWYQLTPKHQLIYFKSLLDNNRRSTNVDNNIALDAPSTLEEKVLQSDMLPESLHIGKTVKIITIIDTGGQPGYIHLLPAIVNCPTINFIVHDMTKDLEDPVLVRYKKEGQDMIKPYQLNYTNKDLIKLTMTLSTESLRKSDSANFVKNTLRFISFVGTHKDQIEESERSERMESLNKQLNDIIKQQNCQVEVLNTGVGDNAFLFAVDNTTAGRGVNEDKTVKQIRRKIESVMEGMKSYPLPINWMILELELQELRNTKKLSYITFKEYSNIAKDIASIVNEEEIKDSLRYYNFLEVLLYFEDIPGLCDYVIIDQQWLYNKVSMFVHLPSKLISFLRVHSQELFESSGILLKDECHNIKWEEDIHIEHFISFLIHKKIIAYFTMDEKQYYYLPYILPHCHLYHDKHQFLLSEPLLIQFSNGVLPRGFFCLLVVHLLQKLPCGWQHDFKLSPSNGDSKKHFINVMTFCLPDGFCLRMQDKVYYLELQVRHHKDSKLENASYNPKIFPTLQPYFIDICKQLEYDSEKLRYGFLCHDRENIDDDHIALIPSLEAPLPRSLQCNRKCDNRTIIGNLHTIWFDKRRTDEICDHPTVVATGLSDSKPKVHDLIEIVIPKIQAEWEEVAFILQFEIHEVKNIKQNCKEDPRKCCLKLFIDWLETDQGISPKTWATLLDKLGKIPQLTAVTEKIKLKLST